MSTARPNVSKNSTPHSWKVSTSSSRKNLSMFSTSASSSSSLAVFLKVRPLPPSYLPLTTHLPLPAVDVDDWLKFTDYRGYSTDDQVIKWFWQCIRSWPAERKSRLLQFVTGTSRIPVNGFKDLQGSDGPRRFTIEKSGDPSQLPKSHTCFNRVSSLNTFEVDCC